jgi:chromosome segregation ATPase
LGLERAARLDRSATVIEENGWMSSGLADQIRSEIETVRSAIEEQKSLAKRHVENVAVETEITQRLRALHTRLRELERNLQQCQAGPDG